MYKLLGAATTLLLANSAFSEEVAPLDCSIYRQGPILTQEIAIYREPPLADYSNAEMTEIHYQELYAWGPGGSQDGRPDDSLLVDINISDGQPLPRQIRNSTPPQERTFFTMLLQGKPYGPLNAVFSIYSGSRSSGPSELTKLSDGTYYYPLPPFEYSGVHFHGFDQVNVLDAQERTSSRFDSYIRVNEKGDVISYMRCNKIGSVLVPHCTIYERTNNFIIDYGYLRSEMYLIDTIRQNAHDFANCLTAPIEGED